MIARLVHSTNEKTAPMGRRASAARLCDREKRDKELTVGASLARLPHRRCGSSLMQRINRATEGRPYDGQKEV